MRKKCLTGLLLAFTAGAASAEVLVFDYVAAVQSVTTSYPPFPAIPLDSYTFYGVTVKPGDTLTGSFTIDTGTPLFMRGEEAGAQSATYASEQALHINTATAQVKGSGMLFSPPASGYGARIHVGNAQPGSGTDFVYFVNSRDELGAPDYLSFNFRQAAGTMLADTSLDSIPNILAVDNGVVYYSLTDNSTGSSYAVTGLMSSLTLRPTSPVPEPSTYAMLFFGLAAVGTVARRRARRAGAMVGV